MKNYLSSTVLVLITFLVLGHHGAFAQKDKIDWDNDAITVNGKSYAKMVRKTVGLALYDYSISAFQGPELMYVKAVQDGEVYWNATLGRYDQRWIYEVNFIASGAKCRIPWVSSDKVARMIVENNLILNGALDPEAERRFIQLNNGAYPMPPTTEQPATPTVIVNVNANPDPAAAASGSKSNAPVTLEGSSILQDGKVIGKYRDAASSSSYSEKVRLVTIYNANGEKVAEADAPAQNAEEWNLKTLSDNKTIKLFYDSPKELEALFKFLNDKGYLNH